VFLGQTHVRGGRGNCIENIKNKRAQMLNGERKGKGVGRERGCVYIKELQKSEFGGEQQRKITWQRE